MERQLVVDRLYSLGDFKNVRFGDTYINIPESLITNTELTSAVTLAQIVGVELSFRKYLLLQQELQGKDLEEATERLEELSVEAMQSIQSILDKTNDAE
ncbi:hypothetical protein LCGC14_0680270 [marine sediment metagenome]|uniref:Uncharacterized protein n=1 Tax=marine sediment metagenome TaxID=412755 RepID=A0A0F9QTB3_9ZZZZ